MTNIKNELISHKDLYVWTQINFTFNSNKIEGSHLSKNQIKQIFEENDLTIHSDDALEARNHFRLFDYMLKTVDEPLSKEMMIQMNMILKRGTSYEDNPYNVGGFKIIPNKIGLINVIDTSLPVCSLYDFCTNTKELFLIIFILSFISAQLM